MSHNDNQTFTVFAATTRIAHGLLSIVAVAAKAAGEHGILIFNDLTGKAIDVDTRGSDDEIIARYAPPPEPPRGRGRPKLGVVAREVTLLPRHWEWLSDQKGGASVTLRQLVDAARHASAADVKARTRQAHEASYHFMHAIAGDLPGYEEATRALFANDRAGFEQHIAHWPHDIRAHAITLGFEHHPPTDA